MSLLPTISQINTPNERLAEIIAASLTDAGLVLVNWLDELTRKLTNGTAKAEDWSHWIKSPQREMRREEWRGDE